MKANIDSREGFTAEEEIAYIEREKIWLRNRHTSLWRVVCSDGEIYPHLTREGCMKLVEYCQTIGIKCETKPEHITTS